MCAVVVRGIRRAALPLMCYYALTLGLPLANGAAVAGAVFVRHALVVLVVPLFVVALASMGRELVCRALRVHH